MFSTKRLAVAVGAALAFYYVALPVIEFLARA